MTTQSNDTYNGWTNYETWNANLWIDNDWQLSERIALITADLFSSYEDTNDITHKLSESIKAHFIDDMPELGASFYSDMINASLSEVNFYEIASHYVENELLAQEQDKI